MHNANNNNAPRASQVCNASQERYSTSGERKTPQVKICGLTVPEQARQCAQLGADAIGLVFHPPSPRHVTLSQAAAISRALPPHVAAVGVFVNPALDLLKAAIEACALSHIQLHGNEPPELLDEISDAFHIPVIKALFASREPGLNHAARFHAAAYLVECGKGPLPGGNAETWDWGSARGFAQVCPTVLAGGLTPHNVVQAIGTCLPDAVDASSGLEAAPGRKDLDKVSQLLANVKKTASLYACAAKTPHMIFR